MGWGMGTSREPSARWNDARKPVDLTPPPHSLDKFFVDFCGATMRAACGRLFADRYLLTPPKILCGLPTGNHRAKRARASTMKP